MIKKELLINPENIEWEEISLSGMKIKYFFKNEERQ